MNETDFYYFEIIKKLISLKDNGIKSYVFSHFNLYDIKNPSIREQEIISISKQNISKAEKYELYKKYTKENLNHFYNENEVDELYYNNPKVISNYNFVSLSDQIGKFYNVIGGKRFTVGCPEKFNNYIYVFGHSLQMGYYTEDKYTISSQLQLMVGNDYKVINYGISGIEAEQLLHIINNCQFKSGDIIVLNRMPATFCENAGISYFDTSILFNRPHQYGEIFLDMMHLNRYGLKIISEKIYECIINNLYCLTIKNNEKYISMNFEKQITNKVYSNIEDSKEFKDFMKKLSIKKQYKNNIGSIVVNCNPFTNGHKYIIENAASKVDWLYVFVVEEDKSYFKFQDRLNMVKLGTSHLKNITIIESGKYIISSLTFPEYFNKENKVTIDPSLDIRIFGKYICNILNIKTRFVGEEPFDMITYQYNKELKLLLKNYNVDLIEIKRLELDGIPISASNVRSLIKDNIEMVKEMVPISTYEYLCKHLK